MLRHARVHLVGSLAAAADNQSFVTTVEKHRRFCSKAQTTRRRGKTVKVAHANQMDFVLNKNARYAQEETGAAGICDVCMQTFEMWARASLRPL